MSKFGAPKNLYELCEQTVDAILMRPLNYYQDDFATDADTVMVNDDALFTSTGGGKYTNAKGFNEKPGTKAYARAGADGLKRFMKKHEMRLKAAKLVHLEGSKAQYKVVLPKALQNTEE